MLTQQQKHLRILLLSCLAIFLSAVPGSATDRVVETKSGPVKVETVAKALDFPWSIAFLPDGRMLVSERPGTLRIVDKNGEVSDPIKGVPEVVAGGAGFSASRSTRNSHRTASFILPLLSLGPAAPPRPSHEAS
jgi:glucose/arabinose dehydrogenase